MPASVTRRRILLLALALAAVAAALVLAPQVWELRGWLGREKLQSAAEMVAAMGPLAFFAGLAILPLFGVPVSPFLIAASAFGATVAVLGCVVALSINMALGWLIAGRLFRPFFERLVARFGYAPPQLSPGSMVSAALLLRITPGIPFPLQNYLLGLARMPFGRYMAVSVPTNAAVACVIVLAGDAILKGNGALALLALAAGIALVLALRWARLRYRRAALESQLDGSV